MLTRRAAKQSEASDNPDGPKSGSARAIDRTSREWLGLRELTQYADISERTLRSWIYSPVDPLPAAKVSGKVLVRKSDFDAYLERHQIRPLEELNLDAIVRDVIKGVADGR
jgi:hypothetical protein